MQKYRLFDKIIKTKPCTYYQAQHLATHQLLTVKKLARPTNWQQLLKNKDLTIMKHSNLQHFPLIHQIVKEEDEFYVILQKLDRNLEYVIKADIDKESLLRVGRMIVELVVELGGKDIYPREIRPAHVFVREGYSGLKLTHLETFPKDLTKLDLVQLQDLRYLSPEQVLTSKQIDSRSLVFNAGLLICDLVLGKSLITANTKMHYMYQLCRLFPQQNIHELKPQQTSQQDHGDSFDKIIRQYNFSTQFVALLKQMLKIDRSERLRLEQLIDAYDVVVENENQITNHKNDNKNKNNNNNTMKYPIQTQDNKQHQRLQTSRLVYMQNNPSINNLSQQTHGFQFQFQQKPTLSHIPVLKISTQILAQQRNIQDDVSQPIIIRQSTKPSHHNNNINTHSHSHSHSKDNINMSMSMNINKVNNVNNVNNVHKLNTTKGSTTNKSRMTFKHPSLSTIRKPQLTNYALNQVNLGVQMAMNPSIYSDHQL